MKDSAYFISYSQNYEDVMLRRALKDVGRGFYIDVGANHPEKDSVTKAFYDLGWQGINIEPVKKWFEKLKESRPRDINLNLAAGDYEGELEFYDVVDTGLSTSDSDIAMRHEKELGVRVNAYKVQVAELNTICEKHVKSDIHFLKIDVEGAELQVLKGLDLKKIRPWIVVIESTLPNSELEKYTEWEHQIINADYSFVYFDGLNRFYVAKEHSEINESFNVPPNFFDRFKMISEHNLEKHVKWLHGEWEAAVASVKKVQGDSGGSEELARSSDDKMSILEERVGFYEEKANIYKEQVVLHKEAMRLAKENIEFLVEKLGGTQDKLDQANDAVDALECKINEKDFHAEAVEHALQLILDSRVWRSTWPLRMIMQGMKSMLIQLKNIVRRLLYKLIDVISTCPKFKVKVVALLQRFFPESCERLKLIVESRSCRRELESGKSYSAMKGVADLTPEARRVYHELKAAIEEKSEEKI